MNTHAERRLVLSIFALTVLAFSLFLFVPNLARAATCYTHNSSSPTGWDTTTCAGASPYYINGTPSAGAPAVQIPAGTIINALVTTQPPTGYCNIGEGYDPTLNLCITSGQIINGMVSGSALVTGHAPTITGGGTTVSKPAPAPAKPAKVPTCPAGQILDVDICICPGDTTWNGSQCVNNTPICPAPTSPSASGNTGTAGSSGSQTFTTPGSHTFRVPNYSGTLKAEVWGGGGGGSGAHTGDTAGGSSRFSSITAGGGGKGSNEPSGGVASGGDTNTSGGNGTYVRGGDSPSGGAGGPAGKDGNSTGKAPGGGGGPLGEGVGQGGGGGAYSQRTYSSGQLTVGSSIAVTVGAGGKGDTASWNGSSMGGGNGANGAVKIAWTSTAQTASLCSAGYTFDDGQCVSTASCTVCPPGQTLNARGQCMPDTVCSPGYHFDDELEQCILNAAPTCPAGSALDTLTHECVIVPDSLCPAGTHIDPATLQCVPNAQCPAGQSWNGSGCVCPAGTVWYQNQCQVGLCVPGFECGNDGNVYRKNMQCELTLHEECQWGCANGACNPAPAPEVVTWKVTPTLVAKNKTTVVSWEVRNVTSCSVSGTNGDSWTGMQGVNTSSPLIGQTTYTLHCTPYTGQNWTDRTAIVNIIPVFQEQ